jgi:hypothetical protein
MLEKPNLPDEKMSAVLQDAYSIVAAEIAAALAGGKHRKRHRVEHFVAHMTAGDMRSATALAYRWRECGSDPLLWRDSHIRQLYGRNAGGFRRF